MQKAFSYQPLDVNIDSTRLVEIESTQVADAPLNCRLVHVAFKNKPKHKVLSCAWGDNNKKRRIEVNGGFLDIGQNLFDALCFLRKRPEKGLYWIDALCINQVNIPECTRQLGIMGQIYFRASTVIVWLGIKYLKIQEHLSESQFNTFDSIKAGPNNSAKRD